MTYKFLNTIIDDLFAFVIKMPVLHRLSVFRDVCKGENPQLGLELFTFQIQMQEIYIQPQGLVRWVYPVDKKRINEFGFGGEEDQASTGAEAIAAKEEEKKTN
nr:hypothetical protein VITISV_043512 [Vitis vinifera]